MLRHLRNILIVFLLLSTHLAAEATVYYVTYGGQPVTGGWQTVTTLADAISKAVANDEIWIQGSENALDAYHVPVDGYIVKSGVKIYGGFRGMETNISQREYVGGKRYKLKYRTMLTGDTEGNDKINDVNFIFPIGEATNGRTDNATHVLTLDMSPTQASGNSNGYPTIVNGLTIARGHNKTGNGAGIIVTGNNSAGGSFRIEQCFFLANYASKGGAVYIASTVKHTADDNRIDRCAFFNNAAGVRTLPSNSGAAIYVVGDVKIVNSVIYNNANGGINGTEASDADDIQVINSTITRNSGSGIEGKKIKVYNTVVWGNTTISTTDRPETISHCAFIGAAEGGPNYNVSLAEKNLDAKGPAFATPSLRIGYDSEFSSFTNLYPAWNWESQGETTLVDRGSNDNYDVTSFGSEDLVGDPRIGGSAIDIGAYEYLPVASSRIRYVRQGGTGDGTSWENASGNLQRMIDDLADTGGEVWVAAGTYEPVSYLVSDKVYTASFRMRNGVSVYGGFSAATPESSKNDRVKGTMSWEFTNETVLQGQGYRPSSWGTVNSSSRHVVWFAPLAQDSEAEAPFRAMTYLDGVTVAGGYASGGNGTDDFLTDRGAGIYMKGNNVSVTNCIVKNNYATGPGGGIYMDGGGRVERTLVFNNVSNDNGGAVYMDGVGIVRRCMLANNQSRKGAGAYLRKAAAGKPESLQLSTCVVSNNTSTHNGAVYCDNGGVVVHNTIVNNLCTKTTDTADGDAAQTGGLYIDGYALLVNSVLWNNRFGSVDGTNIPVYIKNPSVDKVRFRYNAISGTANAVWNSTYQEETLFLADGNGGDANMPGPDFDTTNANLDKEVGVQTDWEEINYFWPTAAGSTLWSAGLEQGRFPSEVQVAAELDIAGNLFSNKPSIGASYTKELVPVPDDSESGKLILYVSSESVSKDGDGSSWSKPFRSINKAIAYFAGLSKAEVNNRTLEIRVWEGDLWPRYSFVNEDPKSATINLQQTASGALLRLEGGWYYDADAAEYKRDPLTHRSIIEGNREGRLITEGVYHVLTAEAGVKVELNGFHIVNGYAAGQAAIQHGAGLLAYDGADVTLLNCIFEDNSAVSGAAVYAEGNAKVAMRNCVVNNNTNTDAASAEAVVYCANNANLDLEHVSFLNNEGAAPANLGTSSFALNNTGGNSAFGMATTGAEGARNFANPANDVGAKLGFDTYLGGYAVYRPLTSSKDASDYIINKVSSGTSASNKQDITAINDRDLGGVPDLGAYEAILPEKGKVIYVRDYGNTTAPGGDGSSWDEAINGNSLDAKYKNNHSFDGVDAELYPEGEQLTGLQWAVDEAFYRSLEKDGDKIKYSIISGVTHFNPGSQSNVDKSRTSINVSNVLKDKRVEVWVAEGEYLRREGFFMREGVDVYGGFAATGTPGKNERQPKSYETVIETNKNTEVTEDDVTGEGQWGPQMYDFNKNITATIKDNTWKVVDYSSYHSEGPVENCIDGDANNNYWHSYYDNNGGSLPQWVLIDLGHIETVRSLKITNRQYFPNAYIIGYATNNPDATPNDNTVNESNLTQVAFSNNNSGGAVQILNFNSAITCRYLYIKVTGSTRSFVDIREIQAYSESNAKNEITHITEIDATQRVYDLNGSYTNAYKAQRVLTQPFPYFQGTSQINGSTPGSNLEFDNKTYNAFKYETSWDGFFIQNGRIKITHQRDGGAGVALRENGRLANCVIRNNVLKVGTNARGAGIFQNGGIIENCVVEGNTLIGEGGNIYGCGMYQRTGTVFNTSIVKNVLKGSGDLKGTAVFFENGRFYNNTITGNDGQNTVYSGQWFSNGRIDIYNTIVCNNNSNGTLEFDCTTNSANIILKNCMFNSEGDHKTFDANYTGVDKNSFKYLEGKDPFVDAANGDYRLVSDAPAINAGTENLGKDITGTTDIVLPSYDADYTDRVKDCTVDIGAYERNNQDNVKPDLTTETGKAIYYVNQNGAGTANGDSPANAACATKLQEVLNAAGEYAADNLGKDVIVKVAGYESGSFTYHVNTLADPKNPQSYSYSIPYGVTVMGGYNEGTYKNGVPQGDGSWNEDNRDITKYRTVFSAIKQATSTTQEVQGYHTVTFKGIPEYWKEGDRQTVIDGVYIQDGSATSLSGGDNDDIKGGAAIVPAGAHVRNCVIQDNEAMQGGGLYVLPGGWVSGCVIKKNNADGEGGGIYAKSDNLQHAYLVSNTIAENTAAHGGGVYIEKGAAMTLNSVIWNNHANSDKNVSAAVNEREKDGMLDAMISELPNQDWYPFNNCYVESIELPYNLQNTKMESSMSTYFANEDYVLKYYSPLIDHGMVNEMQTYLTGNKNVSAHDMQGLNRLSTGDIRTDVGAFAFEGKMLDDTKLLKRIFVSHNSEYVLAEAEAGKDLMGKTFYTPFTWLGDALEYIRTVRENNVTGAREAEFEIYVAAGTYTPKYQRPDDTGTEIPVIDLRQNSFIVPYGVKIYGGFTGMELYSSNVEGEAGIGKITFESGEIDFTPLTDGNVNTLLTSRKGSDFNDNQVEDAWEMAEQTILSGNINLSNEEQNVYHVLYSAKDAAYTGEQKVLLDGVTIQDGRTLKEVGDVQDAPKGRGGGIYSNGVHYTVVNSRLLNNKAVRGGAAFIQNADLTLVNSMVAGNEAWKEGNIVTNKNASGGGVFVISIDGGKSSLKAVNTLWANNESVEAGGAIGAEGAGASIDLMNNTFVMNKAENDAMLYHTAATMDNVKVVNTMMWGNESIDDKVKNVTVIYSASDRDYSLSEGKSLFGPENGYNNIFLSKDNLALDGPRFAEPSTKTGLDGYNLNSKWNPIAVSPLTDHGNGMKNPAGDNYVGDEQAYRDWFITNAPEYADKYMLSPDYLRYSGPNQENGDPDNKPIDIGVYEYQYVLEFSKMDKIYVATESCGKGTGESWQNATDDLRGALIGAANPESGGDTRNVYIRGGNYPWPAVTSGNSVFPVHIGGKIDWAGLNITGSCTGAGDEQDFSKPTVINRHPFVTASNYLMEISSSHSAPKSVTVSGLTFSNSNVGNNINDGCSGVKVAANNGTLTMKHVAFRNNPKAGLDISSNSGNVLLVNALFADNGVTGLNVSDNPDNATLVNTTFANNGTDMTNGLTNVYNSTSWSNGTQNMPATEMLNNKVFAANTVNNDIEQGPNFYDPDNADKDLRDYRIRPSLTLLNSGSNGLYLEHALGNAAAMPETERDLYNVSRVVGGTIDIGAYEYRAPLQQIVYVKEGIVKDNDGKSWETALTDLQNAANLAGIYAKQLDMPAYVFVHNNVSQGLNIQLNKVKVYGGMNDEVTQQTVTKEIVNDLLSQRVGLLERTNRSQITGALVISGDNSVVDGFEVNVSPVIYKGILSTSVVTKDVIGAADGILYNTLVKGSVSDVKTVNVTATGEIEDVEGNGNNRTGAAGDNIYVATDDWEYQLMETSADIDAGTTDINDYITMVGHSRDIAGNKRIRNTVDNGCFETWNITKEMTADNVVTEDDYPHGKSVVYVRHTDGTGNDGSVYDGGAELLITKNYTDATPFNPGFLLLEHHAGLRANNKAVGLTHFAVERNIDASGTDMTVMPFEVTRTEGTAMLSLYDAATRAGYSYQYSGTDGAWTGTNYNTYRTPITTGWLLEGTAGSKVRFYGDSYVENVDAGKSIELLKNNFNEPWTSSSAGGNRFTHKENMSWNLFGSPYLCAMNYSDMKYGRVMYGYLNGAYTTLNTIDDNAEGYIPAGDAVFTQTATLKERETIEVEIPTVDNKKSGTAYLGSKDMAVALSRAYTRSGGDCQEDRLQLKAVPAGESRSDFDINGDGVKWMSAGRPQIYARQGGGRYSLLSAVSIEGEVSVGVSLPEAGMYTFAIPADCNVDDYETVVLKDNETGKTVDLLEGQYDFSTAEAGDVEGRFTISFNRMLNDKTDNGLRIFSPKRNTVRVEGLSQDDVVTVYSVSGATVTSRVASSSVEQFTVAADGVVLVEVMHNGRVVVKKIRV